MSTTVQILVIEDDPASQAALRQVLDSEEWRVQIIAHADGALPALATGDWTLVVASVGTTGLNSALFSILRELSQAPAMESGTCKVRVLFLIPETNAGTVQPQLEQDHLPYVLKPFNLHDVLEKVSDLLMETGAIPQSIRQVRREGLLVAKQRDGRQAAGKPGGRNTGMFAARSEYGDYYSLTEEELAEYETQQQAEIRRKKKNVKDLGSGGH